MSETADARTDEQKVADGMYPYFNREWGDKIKDALRQRPDVAKNAVALLLTDAYLCGVRDGSFGMRTLAQEMARESVSGTPL